jgi:hypothetical protein
VYRKSTPWGKIIEKKRGGEKEERLYEEYKCKNWPKKVKLG